MNIPTHVGGRYLCFVIVRPDRGYGGPYGQTRRPLIWRCVECGHEIPGHTGTFKVWGTARAQVDGYGNAVSPPVGFFLGGRLRDALHSTH